MKVNIISSFVYGDHATEVTLAKAFHNLGHEVFINKTSSDQEASYIDMNVVVHMSHTWKNRPPARLNILYHPDSTVEYNSDLFKFYDYVFLAHNSPHVDDKKIFYLPLAYDTRIKQLAKQKKKHIATFIGTWYPERQFLRQVPNLTIFGNGWGPGTYVATSEEKWTIESASLIGVNHVRPDSTDNNIRLYELCALGTFQLTNKTSPELRDGFDLVVYSDLADLKEKIQYYTDHKDKREKIARHGQETAKEYTFEFRVKQILEVIQNVSM